MSQERHEFINPWSSNEQSIRETDSAWKRMAKRFPSLYLDQLSTIFDHPSLYIHKSVHSNLRYHVLGFTPAGRDYYEDIVELPLGIRPEDNTFLYLYQNFDVHPQTASLMTPRQTLREFFQHSKPVSTIQTQKILAISSLGLRVNLHNHDDIVLLISDFHSARFGPKNDASRESYELGREGLGYLKWSRLFADTAEQLAIRWNELGMPRIGRIVIRHNAPTERPGKGGTYKGQRISAEKRYHSIEPEGYSYQPIERVVRDNRFQNFLTDNGVNTTRNHPWDD